jgi:5-keto 4-deoxyuronate isomerase
MLTKQAIRKGVLVTDDKEKVITKEELVARSEKWTEREEVFFRKMLKQGGTFSVKGKKYRISVPDQLYNQKGEVEVPIHEKEEK